jgi:hypothetical protein
MGFLKKVGKAISHTAHSVGHIAKSVLPSKVVNLATKALNFVPGLNAAGLIGKGLSLLGSGGNIQKWLKNGLNIFGGLAKGFGLTGKVAGLFSGKNNPLGMISNLIGGASRTFQKVANVANQLMPNLNTFQNGLNLAKALGAQGVNLQNLLVPPGLQETLKGINQMANVDPIFTAKIGNPAAQFQAIAGMFQEVSSIVNPGNLGKGLEQIIRA